MIPEKRLKIYDGMLSQESGKYVGKSKQIMPYKAIAKTIFVLLMMCRF